MANGFQSLSPLISPAAACCAFTWVAFTFPGFAQDDEPAKRVGIILEGSFESPDVFKLAKDSKLTHVVPFYEWDYGVRPFDEAYWTKNQFTWERILAIGKRVADDLLEVLEPDLVRDERGVVEYAIIHDKDPFLTSILLSDKLLKKFEDTLGDRLLVVCIDRHLVYLFPAAGGKIDDFGPALVDEFRQTRLPVSLEVFLVDADGYRVIGELQRE